MSRLFFLLLVIISGFAYSCRCTKEDKCKSGKYYCNTTGVIVKMSDGDSLRRRTFTMSGTDTIWKRNYHTPIDCGMALVRDDADTTAFIKLGVCDGKYPLITHEWYENHYVGDHVHFDFINKYRYFHIK